VQLIKRKQNEQWFINFPSAIAQAMEFGRGEIVEWLIEDKGQLVLRRLKVPPSGKKIKLLESWSPSIRSGIRHGPHLARSGRGGGLARWR